MEHDLSPDAFNASRIPLSGALGDFLGAGSTAPEDARRELMALVDEHVDAGSGVLVGFSRLLGEMLPQDNEGTQVRVVRDRGTAIGEGARARYSDSRFGGNLHTDGAEAPLPAPELFTLLCTRQADVGGALELIHLRDIVAALSDQPDVLDTLRAHFHFDRRGDQPEGESPTVRKPVIFEQGGRAAITHLRSYIEKGHAHPPVPDLSAAQLHALDTLDAVIASDEHPRTGKLRPGELALFDNLSLLHGRTEFQDEPDRSRLLLLLRTWIRRSG